VVDVFVISVNRIAVVDDVRCVSLVSLVDVHAALAELLVVLLAAVLVLVVVFLAAVVFLAVVVAVLCVLLVEVVKVVVSHHDVSHVVMFAVAVLVGGVVAPVLQQLLELLPLQLSSVTISNYLLTQKQRTCSLSFCNSDNRSSGPVAGGGDESNDLARARCTMLAVVAGSDRISCSRTSFCTVAVTIAPTGIVSRLLTVLPSYRAIGDGGAGALRDDTRLVCERGRDAFSNQFVNHCDKERHHSVSHTCTESTCNIRYRRGSSRCRRGR